MTLPALLLSGNACSRHDLQPVRGAGGCESISAARARAQPDGQTDGRTPDRCIDPAANTMRAASIFSHSPAYCGARSSWLTAQQAYETPDKAMAAVMRPTASDTLPLTYPVAIRQAAGSIEPPHASQTNSLSQNVAVKLLTSVQSNLDCIAEHSS